MRQIRGERAIEIEDEKGRGTNKAFRTIPQLEDYI